MITLNHLSKTFNAGTANEVLALQDLSLDIEDGEFMVLVGANGSGKSTLLNVLAGNLRPDRGEILVGGKDISRMKDFERSRSIARIFQNPQMGTASELSILENFRLASLRTQAKGLHIGTGATFRKRVMDKIAPLNLGLETKLDQAMGTLSGGQRQALTLLMATMDETKILLLDEPTAALDPRSSGVLMELAERIIREMKLTAILVTHQLRDVTRFGNRVVQLDQGRILRDLSGKSKKDLQWKDVLEWFGD